MFINESGTWQKIHILVKATVFNLEKKGGGGSGRSSLTGVEQNGSNKFKLEYFPSAHCSNLKAF